MMLTYLLVDLACVLSVINKKIGAIKLDSLWDVKERQVL
jgi:hypothetical protein